MRRGALALGCGSGEGQDADPPPRSPLARLVGSRADARGAAAGDRAAAQQLEETQQLSLAPTTGSRRCEGRSRAVRRAAVEERLAKIEESVQRVPELRATWSRPASSRARCACRTDVALKLGASSRREPRQHFGALGPRTLRYVVDPGRRVPEAGKEPRFVSPPFPAGQLDVRTPTGVGAMPPSSRRLRGLEQGLPPAPRVRQWKGLIVGQSASTFADPEASRRDRLSRAERDRALPPAARALDEAVGAGFSLAPPSRTRHRHHERPGREPVPTSWCGRAGSPPRGRRGRSASLKGPAGRARNLALLSGSSARAARPADTTLATTGFGSA